MLHYIATGNIVPHSLAAKLLPKHINSGHGDLYGVEEYYFRATKLDFPEVVNKAKEGSFKFLEERMMNAAKADVLKGLSSSFPNLVMITDSSSLTASHKTSVQGHVDVVNLLLGPILILQR
ncbi:hypothetical protein Tco_0965024 [Tanacetum coccineum]